MGMNSNIKYNFAIAEDGTIKRTSNELDIAMLNIIRVGASKDDILAAYKARKKCYQLCKESAKRPDYREYVETLQLDNFPNELKKADHGKRYVRLLWCMLVSFVLGISSMLFGCIYIWDKFYCYRYNRYNVRSYTRYINWQDIFIGVLYIAFAVALFFLVKYIYKRLTLTSQSIKSLKSV